MRRHEQKAPWMTVLELCFLQSKLACVTRVMALYGCGSRHELFA